jgi:leucyl aminopeptidase
MDEVAVEVKAPGDGDSGALAVPVFEEEEAMLSDRGKGLGERLRDRLARLAAEGELKGERGQTLLLHTDGELAFGRVVAVGLGKREELDADVLRTAAAAVADRLDGIGGSVTWPLDESLPLPLGEQARAVVEGTVLGSYDPGRWKSEQKQRKPVEEVVLSTANRDSLGGIAVGAARVAGWVNAARDLANSPPNELTPEGLAARAAELAGPGVQVEALDPAQIDELGMGALSAVGRASANGPRLIVLRYEPQQPARIDVVLGLVGKAITFDAGGISLKPALKMEDMKGDMAGGAAVIAGTAAVAELELPVRLLAVVAAAENLVSGTSFRPGDILRAANGKTIEITNTDAEGRLVLADAMWYARREGATHLLDLATLTGAMVFALGDLYAGVFANDERWLQQILAAANASGDHAWPFPLHPRYRRYVDSTYADLKNSSDLREAGPVLAAEFLHEFAGEGPWAHIDMAGPGFLARSRGDYLTQSGGTGYGVRLIVELCRQLAT